MKLKACKFSNDYYNEDIGFISAELRTKRAIKPLLSKYRRRVDAGKHINLSARGE